MKDYIIITDSTADLPKNTAKELNIEIIPMELTFDGEKYFNEDNIESKDFYERIRNGELSKTTCTNTATFCNIFEPFLKNGKDVLYICFSSGLSRTYECAVAASNELKEIYPQNKVIVIDSVSASLGQGMLAYYAAKKRNENETIDNVANWLEKFKYNICHWFTVDDLFHLKRGGRISAASATFGTVLNIKPILNIDNEGHLVPKNKVRGRKASLLALIDQMEKNFIPEENDVVFISHSDALEDAQFIADQIKEKFNISNFVINHIGPTIGTHTGAGTIALFFIAKER